MNTKYFLAEGIFSNSLYNKLASHGFEVLDENFVMRFSFTVETLRCCLYKSLEIDHPLAVHIEDMIEIIETEDELPNLD